MRRFLISFTFLCLFTISISAQISSNVFDDLENVFLKFATDTTGIKYKKGQNLGNNRRKVNEKLVEYFDQENITDYYKDLLNGFIVYNSNLNNGDGIDNEFWQYIITYGNYDLLKINNFMSRSPFGSREDSEVINALFGYYNKVNSGVLLFCLWNNKEELKKALENNIGYYKNSSYLDWEQAGLILAYLNDDIDSLLFYSKSKYPIFRAFSYYAVGDLKKASEEMLLVDIQNPWKHLECLLRLKLGMKITKNFPTAMIPYVFMMSNYKEIPLDSWSFNLDNARYTFRSFIFPYLKLVDKKDNIFIYKFYGNYLIKKASELNTVNDYQKKLAIDGNKEASKYFIKSNCKESIVRLAETWFDRGEVGVSIELYRISGQEKVDEIIGKKLALQGNYAFSKQYLKKIGYKEEEIASIFAEIAYRREEFDLAKEYFLEIGNSEMVSKAEYNIVKNGNSLALFKEYILKYPNSDRVNEIKIIIDDISSSLDEINEKAKHAEELYRNEKYNEAYEILAQSIVKYSNFNIKEVKDSIIKLNAKSKEYYIMTDKYTKNMEKYKKFEKEKISIIEKIRPIRKSSTIISLIQTFGNTYIIDEYGYTVWEIQGHRVQVVFNEFGGIEIILVDGELVV